MFFRLLGNSEFADWEGLGARLHVEIRSRLLGIWKIMETSAWLRQGLRHEWLVIVLPIDQGRGVEFNGESRNDN